VYHRLARLSWAKLLKRKRGLKALLPEAMSMIRIA
jgi:hypothetical protein